MENSVTRRKSKLCKEASDLKDYKTPFSQVSGLYLEGAPLNISTRNELLCSYIDGDDVH